MHITNISAANLKGRTFSHDLEPATLISGPNFSGKTSVATAIRLGLAGFLPPPIGKTAGSIYGALAGNPDESGQIDVAVGIDGKTYTTRWIRNSRGSTSVQGGVPTTLALPSVLVDPRTFFAKTGPERAQAIFEACQVTLGADDVAKVIKSSAMTAFPVQRRNAVLGEVSARAKALLSAKPPQVAMAELIEETKARHKATKDRLKEQSAVIRAINWDGEIPQDVSVEMADAFKRASAADIALSQVDAQAKDAEKRAQAEARSKENIDRLTSEIALHRWDSPPVAPDTSRLELAETELKTKRQVNIVRRQQRAAIAARLEEVSRGTCPTCGTCGTALESAVAVLREEQAKIPPDHDNLLTLETEIAALRLKRQKFATDQAAYERDMDFVAHAERQIEEHRKNAAEESVEPPSQQHIEELLAEKQKAHAALALYREAAAKWEAYQQTSAKRDEAERSMAALTCEEAVLEDVIRALRAKVAATADAAFSKVLSLTRHFTDGILNSPLEYRDELGRRVSQYDVDAGCTAAVGSWISHESFSGTEEAIAYAAFSVALAMRATLRIVILDEVGRLDDVTRAKTLERMVELVRAGTIDQFIGIDTCGLETDGLHQIRLGAPVTHAEAVADLY